MGVKLPKLGSNYPNFTPISPPICGKIGVKLVLWLGLGGGCSNIDWVGVVVEGVKNLILLIPEVNEASRFQNHRGMTMNKKSEWVVTGGI